MKMGDAEWFKRLEEVITFPATLGFYVGADKTLAVKVVEFSGARIGNMQYKKVAPPIGDDLALVGVEQLESPESYYKTAVDIMKRWGIEPRENESA